MNIAQPIASSVESVEFSFLSSDEIRAISVRKIESESTFDTLQNPVAGGLYDTALGSWTDQLCTTCNLGQSLCPGHPGHIELPVPVYHPVFMDQVLRLLRATCAYCYHFRLPPVELNRFVCKLRLLQHGLLSEAEYIDAIGGQDHGSLAVPDVPRVGIDDSDDDEAQAIDGVSRARNAYVDSVLRGHRISVRELRKGKHEGASQLRREIIKEFMKDITKSKVCAKCKGISPSFRKDRFVKIFQKPLTPKEKAQMGSKGYRLHDSMAMRQKSKPSNPVYQSDEGITDMDLSSADDERAETENEDGAEEDTGDELDENGNNSGQTRAHRPTSQRRTEPGQQYKSAEEVRERLRKLFSKEQEVIQLLYNSRPPQSRKRSAVVSPDMFFLQTILVPPNRYRPEARTGGDSPIHEAEQNSLYKMILGASFQVAETYREIQSSSHRRDVTSLHEAWTQLQDCVNSLVDRDKNPIRGLAAKRNADGIKQKLEKKDGLFRKNMMGKRVNYAARSVISPDPNIETNEIGVPPVFAQKLTYPEPVTSHNFKDMQKAVINGVDKWPGASAVENENGQVVNLRNKSAEERVSLANQLLAPTSTSFNGIRNKKVHRHLSNGDVVLMNRQPTLHKPSIMGHRVRVLPGEKTIRMHYANCNTYNADFDGDEMNMHFPQNELARAEALQLADTDHQYISGTQGKPLRGLIQDHLSVSVALCSKDTFLDRAAYQQLIYAALRPENGHIYQEKIELVPPAIHKPLARWTGKQVVTTVLKNIKPPNRGDLWMTGKSQIQGDRWGSHLEEGMVEFRDGELISGILDKSQLGPSSGGFIHAVHEVYGYAAAGKLLSSMGRLLTRFLNMWAFTCGIDDLRLTPEGEANRHKALEPVCDIGLRVAASYVGLQDKSPADTAPDLLERLEDVMRDDTKLDGLDVLMGKSGGELSTNVTFACLPSGLQKQFPDNHMQAMTISGAKGGSVNANLISCNLGQQTLEGRRVPLMVSGKSLPCFRPFDPDVRAGGYITSRFLTGIRPQEYFFHHMAGREGLIDTAVKTSRSGYLQRCLIKGMEGLEVAYDTTVRDSDGTLVQFLYGEDGLDVTKQKYLTDFGFLLHNLDSQLEYVKFSDPLTESLFDHRDDLSKRTKALIKTARANVAFAEAPVNSLFNPAQFAFATSESFFGKMSEYLKQNMDGLVKGRSPETEKGHGPEAKSRIGKKGAEKILAAKYLRSLVEPGEAVGIVAGQSVGEPSTQMTLNTFHLAGHSARNVTLGIPRLREILMTASAKISTPGMTLVLNDELSQEQGETFTKSISVLPLSHVVDHVTVRERLGKGAGQALAKMYDVRLRFYPSTEYKTMYAIDVPHVLDAVEKTLLPMLSKRIRREIKQRRHAKNTAAIPDVGVKAGVVEMAAANPQTTQNVDEEGDEDGLDDDDATNAKQRANRSEAVSYGPNDEDDDRIQQQMEREAASETEPDEDEGISVTPPTSPGVDDASDDSGAEMDGDGDLSKTREARVISHNTSISRFKSDEVLGETCEFTLEFEAKTPKMLMLNMVQEAVQRTVIQQIEGVGSCTFEAEGKIKDPRTGELAKAALVHVEGRNIRAMQKYGEYLDPNRVSTNDIAAVLDVYGVEACRGSIIRELSKVFEVHGIAVDNRHLNLIGDYMTRNGNFTAFNRTGLKGNVSPFTKMSFETTLAFLKDAILDGDWDDLTSPSSRLVMGRLGRTGTGTFDVLTRVPTAHYDSHASN